MPEKEIAELELELDPDQDEIEEAKELERQIEEDEKAEKEKPAKAKKKAKKNHNNASSDSVAMYLREIGKIPPINADEEVHLARDIAEGGQKAEIAKRKLVQSNLKLVVSVAKRYASNSSTLLDLIQEGNMGLMRAADKFDHKKGYKFSTLATWWIRQAISRSIADKSRSIRIPVHMIENASRLRKVRNKLTQQLDRSPTDFELAEALDITLERLQEIQSLQMRTVSTATKVGKDEDSTLIEFIESESAYDAPDQYTISQMLKAELKKSISYLAEDEQNVLILRYGLIEAEGERCYSSTEVAELLDIPKTKIKKIEAKALRKMRARALEEKSLTEYLD